MAVNLEVNPGTLEHDPFAGYLDAGINRLSIGVQTLIQSICKSLGVFIQPTMLWMQLSKQDKQALSELMSI